jgi:hypothetical protein
MAFIMNRGSVLTRVRRAATVIGAVILGGCAATTEQSGAGSVSGGGGRAPDSGRHVGADAGSGAKGQTGGAGGGGGSATGTHGGAGSNQDGAAGSGGAGGTAGAFSGGAGGGTSGPPCDSSACPTTPGLGPGHTQLGSCCTPVGECGYVAVGSTSCQPKNQVGYIDPECPSIPGSPTDLVRGCCAVGGLCGYMFGGGCIVGVAGAGAQRCALRDASVDGP